MGKGLYVQHVGFKASKDGSVSGDFKPSGRIVEKEGYASKGIDDSS